MRGSALALQRKTMIHCYQCGKETEPPFPGVVRALCPECASHAREAAASAQPQEVISAPAEVTPVALPSSWPLVTCILIALNVLVFAAMVVNGAGFISPTPQQVLPWGADFGLLTLSGQWWRLFSSMFLHFGIMHLAFNMWCLWSLGVLAEKLVGRGSFLLLYLFSGIGGGLLSLGWHPMLISAGASGAIFGVAGGLAALFYLKKVAAPTAALKNTKNSILVFVVYNLGYGVMKSGIDNAAHLGGLLAGLALGAALRPAEHGGMQRVLRFPAILGSVAVLLVAGLAVQRVQRPVAQLKSAEDLLDTGKADQAIPLLRGITAEKPDLEAAHYLLGLAYMERSQNDEAETEFQKALALDGENSAYRVNLAAVYLRKNQPDRAVAQLIPVVEKDPQNFLAQVNLGSGYFELKQYDKALAALEKALALRSDDPIPYYLRGACYLGKEDPEKAIPSLEKALALKPGYAGPQRALCGAYWLEKKTDQAAACYEQFLKQHPEDELARRNLASLYRSAGRTREANALLQAAPAAAAQAPAQ